MSLRDLNGRFQVINKLGAGLMGQALEDLLGRTAAELFDAQTAAAIDTQEHAVHRDGSATVFELRGQLPDGSARDYLVTKYPVRDADGQLLGVGGISIDITARKDVDNQLREAEDRFRGAFDSAAIGMALVDPDGRWLRVNPALCELVGYSGDELLGGTFQGITHPDDLEVDLEFVRQMLDGEIQTYQMDKRYFHKLGQIVWIHLSVSLVRDADGAPAYFVSQIQDISEQKRAEELAEQLRHSQKLDALGRLAGGVAHDFNNMLTAIKGYSQLLLDGLPETDPLRSPAEQISRAAEQASALPRQLLAFSRDQPSQPEIVDVNEVVSASSDMLGQLLGEAFELRVNADTQAAQVLIDPGHIEQVLLNLAVNACEAMPEGGIVTITTRSRDLDEQAAAELDVPAGQHVVLAVADRGEGMDADTKAKIFEPFFTTKATGSGLGLSTVYGIVRQRGGFIRVESQPGEGSTFEIWLPHERDHTSHEREHPREPETVETAAGTVLLAEDEPLVRELVVAVLERSGYRVLPAATGEEALALYERGADTIDVLVADMVMPGMGGRELAERVLAQRPDARVVLMSGYTEDALVVGRDDLRQPVFPVFLKKPFAPRALLESVAESIGRSEQARRRARLDIATIATCLVADDHPAVLDSVSGYLEQNGFEVVACATRGDDALAMIAQEQPAIALLDVRMSSLTGIEVARRASLVAPQTRIVLFTGYGDRTMLEQALDAGARAFILKEAPMSELLRALTIVAAGGTYVDPELAGALASGQTAGALSPLTTREQQVLGLVADGMTNETAADALGISPETVQSHIRNAMSKLDADTRTQAVATAFRRSLLA
jgi:two-component system, cell cycle sensor histidine kinase and response regulator CckA